MLAVFSHLVGPGSLRERVVGIPDPTQAPYPGVRVTGCRSRLNERAEVGSGAPAD